MTVEELALDLINVYKRGSFEDVAERVFELAREGRLTEAPARQQPDYFKDAVTIARLRAESS